MERAVFSYLQEWLISSDRKPMVIRGARQVGKTWLVRYLAEKNHKKLLEINFEKDTRLEGFFSSNDPKRILFNLSSVFGQDFIPEETLLFLDEIQAAPTILAKLRWFAEEMPNLPVIAAGSLLEFVLEKHTFSMPVGRITYLYLEPLSFEEFLLAQNKIKLHHYLQQYQWGDDFPELIHQQFIDLFREYIIVGGMPASVANWVEHHSLIKVSQTHNDLFTTYRDDFAKYAKQSLTSKLDEILMAVPKLLGQKFSYSKINPLLQTYQVKQAITLLNKARICHPVISCDANGIPIGAGLNEKFFKEILLDVGLCSTALGLNLNDIQNVGDVLFVNSGGITEQVVGQQLRCLSQPFVEPKLYYWLRQDKSANAEIDYIIQHKQHILPVEVKAGSTGSLKSLHLFMRLKKLHTAVRVNADFPSKTVIKVKDSTGHAVEYSLLSLPFYLLNQLSRLVS